MQAKNKRQKMSILSRPKFNLKKNRSLFFFFLFIVTKEKAQLNKENE